MSNEQYGAKLQSKQALSFREVSGKLIPPVLKIVVTISQLIRWSHFVKTSCGTCRLFQVKRRQKFPKPKGMSGGVWPE